MYPPDNQDISYLAGELGNLVDMTRKKVNETVVSVLLFGGLTAADIYTQSNIIDNPLGYLSMAVGAYVAVNFFIFANEIAEVNRRENNLYSTFLARLATDRRNHVINEVFQEPKKYI